MHDDEIQIKAALEDEQLYVECGNKAFEQIHDFILGLGTPQEGYDRNRIKVISLVNMGPRNPAKPSLFVKMVVLIGCAMLVILVSGVFIAGVISIWRLSTRNL